MTEHLQGKDIPRAIDQVYLEHLWSRVEGILTGLCGLLIPQGVLTAADKAGVLSRLKSEWSGLCASDFAGLRRLKNQGRRPEEVLYSMMRGHLVEGVFGALMSGALRGGHAIRSSGGDQVRPGHDFVRVADADFAVQRNGTEVLRVEVQSAFQSKDLDLKLSKILEAQRRLADSGTPTAVVMFDVNSGWIYWVSLKDTAVEADGRTVRIGTGQVHSRVGGKFEGVHIVSLSDLNPSRGHLGQAKETVQALVEALFLIIG